MNPLLEQYTWCWLYRVNHRMVDGFTTLGSYVRAGRHVGVLEACLGHNTLAN